MSGALVTGAAGFIGANLVRRLLEADEKVVAVVRPGSDQWRLADLGDAIETIELDLRDSETVAATLAIVEPERIFHLAAHGAYSSQREAPRILETNLLATATLLDACLERGIDAFVNSGSSSEYGTKDHAPGESEALEPNSTYAVSKAAATMYGAHRADETGARVVTLRLYSAYGPWEAPGRLVPALVVEGLAGRLPPLVNPRIARDFVHVDDVVDAYLLAAASGPAGAVYNVGTGSQTTIEDAVAAIRDLLGIGQEPHWGSMADRSWDASTWVADSSLIAAQLGWHPRFDFRAGLQQTIDWLRVSDCLPRYQPPPKR